MKFLSIFFLIAIAACSSGRVPKDFLEPIQMESIVYDLIRVDEFVNNFVSKDSTIDLKKKRTVLYEQVFKVHNTTRKQFYESYKYYQQHPDIQKALFDSVYEGLNRKKTVAGRVKPVEAVR
jgi:Domain of unknown function (DUF4296)